MDWRAREESCCTAISFTKSSTCKPHRKRAEPAVGKTWFAPEAYFFSGRAFAGDRWTFGPFDNSSERQRIAVEQIRSHSVPIALIDVNTYPSEFEQRWPLLAAYLNASYRLVTKIPIEDDRVIGVLVLNSRIPSGSVPFRNLPCFH